MKIEALTLTVMLALTACGGGPSSPTQPSASPQPQPTTTASGVTNWNLTQRFGSVTGPDNDWVRGQRQRLTGAVFPDLPMAVTRAGGVIDLDSEFFQVDYTGTFAGSEFSASGREPLEAGGPQMPGASSLSGRFSADDRLLTATEVNTYRLTSGETVTYTWEWQATRRN
jgi:hypothetical protein